MQETLLDPWVGKIPWRRDRLPTPVSLGFPCGSAGKESTCNAGDMSSIPGLGRSPEEGNHYPLQYSGLEKSRDCIVSPWGIFIRPDSFPDSSVRQESVCDWATFTSLLHDDDGGGVVMQTGVCADTSPPNTGGLGKEVT